MDVLQWSRHYRCFPGQGALDVAGFARRVLAAGYAGPLSLEIFNDVFRQADPGRMAVDGMRSLLVLEDELEPMLPDSPELAGFAFVEIGVDARSAEDTERLLRAMGFAATGPHRSKPVHLWEHGDIRVVLNHGVGDDDPEVVAVAVESADPRRSAARAEALLAPVLERHRNPGDADLAAVAAPDGTSLFFCGAGPGAAWRDDFLAVEAGAENGEPPVPIDRIDHITLAQPFEAFDEAALFYRSVLGMRPRQSVEVAAPDGLVRSRAMTGAGGRVRIVLNVPALAGAQGGQAELQHVAFHCDDALGRRGRCTTGACRSCGSPTTTTTTSRRGSTSTAACSTPCARSASCTTAARRASSCTSTRPGSKAVSSSRCSSGAGPTTATAPSTHQFG